MLGQIIRAFGAVVFYLSWLGYANASLVVPAGATVNVPALGLSAGCGEVVVRGSLSLGTGQLGVASLFAIEAGGVVVGGSGTITVGGDWSNDGDFTAGTSTVVLDDSCGTTGAALFGETVFHNLILTSKKGNTFVIAAGASITVHGTLTLSGIPESPIRLISEGGEPVVIRLAQGARLILSDVQVDPSVQILGGGGGGDPTPIPAVTPVGVLILILSLVGIAFRYRRYAV